MVVICLVTIAAVAAVDTDPRLLSTSLLRKIRLSFSLAVLPSQLLNNTFRIISPSLVR